MKWHAFSQSDLDGKLAHAAYMGSPTEVARLIADGANPRADDSEALLYAATEGHLECVKLLIPVSDPMADASRALIAAVEHGHQEIAMLLIPHSDCRANGSLALIYAAGSGQLEVVKELLPVSDPGTLDCLALQMAAQIGHVDIVRELLPHSDPASAYRSCIEFGRVDGAELIHKCLSEQQSTLIHTAIGTTPNQVPRKTRRM
ncbi:ankyrin repeat domain-containing protein [Pseudoxanthomonas winnipegensis]|uniref:ankyrin repeat domain-containing protein n=1 Tax=Pseudoxanthomonas winnipegensis TaxID=2480810 RepID=UPI00103E2BD8|nr:ankyrin repeat domain-containing protein [Pseudoxanthomonas winnipegensis]TBV69748.1 hypothetical protein EYC45_19050 [Pseudoxanthomonas winnipegensis]